MKLVESSVKVLGAALQRNADRSSGLAAILSVIRIRHYAKFGDGIGGRYECYAVGTLIRHTIEQEFIGTIITAAIHADLGRS